MLNQIRPLLPQLSVRILSIIVIVFFILCDFIYYFIACVFNNIQWDGIGCCVFFNDGVQKHRKDSLADQTEIGIIYNFYILFYFIYIFNYFYFFLIFYI
jgi:hypothetical protein